MDNSVLDSNSQPVLWDDPNKFARPAGIEIFDDRVVMRGYQEFILTAETLTALEEDRNLRRKSDLLSSYFTPRYLAGRTVLDLGASAGFFCFLALRGGAEKVIALDMDMQYLALLKKAREKFGFHNLDIIHANIADWKQPVDVTVVLALVHWIYSCTAVYGNLDAIVKKLSSLTGYMSIIEWVEPSDAAIEFFHHTEWNSEHITGPYNRDEFERALGRHFKRYVCIGEIIPTRKIYIAFNTPLELDFSGPLPLLFPRENVIYSKFLVAHEGIEYWSRVYSANGVIYKQATADLAEHEGLILKQLDSDYFPRVYDIKQGNGYSVVKLEKIEGAPLAEDRSISELADKFYGFIQHCMAILRLLNEHGITHRDIRADNIIMRNNQPVLIDFGWAISDKYNYLTPPGLGDDGRLPDGGFCDVYAMGKALQKINNNRYPQFDVVIDMMAEPDDSLRITNLDMLDLLFTIAAEEVV